jgi:predicted dinucleotide-binding enzyme
MHGLEPIRQVAPQARLYRVFNSLGWENFENPILRNQTIDHFYCGDTGEAQSKVENLIRDIGLNPVYLGGLEHSSTLDALTKLWFNLAFQKGYGRRVALKVLSE